MGTEGTETRAGRLRRIAETAGSEEVRSAAALMLQAEEARDRAAAGRRRNAAARTLRKEGPAEGEG